MRIHFKTGEDKTEIYCPSIYAEERVSKPIRFSIFHKERQRDTDLSEIIVSTMQSNRKIKMKLKFPLPYSNFEIQAETYWVDKTRIKEDSRVLEIGISYRLFDLLSNSLGKNKEISKI